jgi:HK97 family phage portal protein
VKINFPFFSKKNYGSVPTNRGWYNVITEPFSGAWQRNIKWERKDVTSYPAVFSCVTLIASDISKLKIKLMRQQGDIWVQVPFGNYGVLQKPNSYQNRIQFIESWLLSKLIRGNTYILKRRDSRGNVTALNILHPDLVLPLVSEDGDVFYQLSDDNLAGVQTSGITVPASEIIHDRFNCMYHPLVGLSPIYASGLTAFGGVKILENSAQYFENGARPSGVLIVPEAITREKAAEMSQTWKEKYSGDNYGNIAILGGDVKYQPISMTAQESQLVELLRMSDEKICSTFHVPPYKIGMGELPNYNNVQAYNVEYLNSALQKHIEDIELCLQIGLELPDTYKVNVDEEGLLRMDTKTQIETLVAGVKGGIDTNNEARKARNKVPIEGGDTIWLQQQDYPIGVLSKRTMPPETINQPTQVSNDNDPEETVEQMFRKALKESSAS